MPAWPAYLLLFASIPLLVPTFARRLGDRVRPPDTSPVARRWLVVAAVLTLVVPTAAIAASSPSSGPERAVMQDDQGNFILTSVESGVELTVTPVEGGQRLTWTDGGPWRANVFYRVYRSEGPDTECEHTEGSTAVYCFLRSAPVATTRSREYLDPSPPPGATYRIGVATNWLGDPEQGDVFAVSSPVSTIP
jgi:hypothetical protein